MSFPGLPEFPSDVPTHPLIVLDYGLLRAKDQAEIDKLWKASTEIGFWYLKNHGVDEEVEKMYRLGRETNALPHEYKIQFDQGDSGMSFGYKAQGAWGTGVNSVPDRIEFMNIAQDDALAYPRVVHRSYPSTVENAMESTVRPFMQKHIDIQETFFEIFDQLLGFPAGTLKKRHELDEPSSTESRNIRNPPIPEDGVMGLDAHTDFGSLTFLHNRLGGLQVKVPDTEDWVYIKPIPGHVVCNLGDAMYLFSGGLLRSNLHRVAPPPGAQRASTRYSLGWLSRPGNSQILRALVEDSPIVAQAVRDRPQQTFETGSTAGEWFARRVKLRRFKNITGPDTYWASRGTEHDLQKQKARLGVVDSPVVPGQLGQAPTASAGA